MAALRRRRPHVCGVCLRMIVGLASLAAATGTYLVDVSHLSPQALPQRPIVEAPMTLLPPAQSQ